MALSLESSLYVWMKAKAAFDSGGTALTPAADPTAVAAFKALKEKLAGVGRNPDLQFLAIDSSLIDDASGAILADVPCKLYGVWVKKAATDVDVFLHLIDDATDDTAADTVARIVLPVPIASQQVFTIYPSGLPMTLGLVAKAYTEYDGLTDSASADTPNGFAIIGAA